MFFIRNNILFIFICKEFPLCNALIPILFSIIFRIPFKYLSCFTITFFCISNSGFEILRETIIKYSPCVGMACHEGLLRTFPYIVKAGIRQMGRQPAWLSAGRNPEHPHALYLRPCRKADKRGSAPEQRKGQRRSDPQDGFRL